MKSFIVIAALIAFPTLAAAEPTGLFSSPAYPEVIGPLGNRLPPSHLRTLNRPSYFAGKFSRWISPTSREGMAWQRAKDQGLYRNHPRQRVEQHYFFPKPWEALQRSSKKNDDPVPKLIPLPHGDGGTFAEDSE